MIDAHRPLYASLKRHGVEYVVIGGIAAIVHGVPRVSHVGERRSRSIRGANNQKT